MQRVDLVLVGFGNVARRFVRLLGDTRESLASRHRLEARIVGIATSRHGCAIDWRGLDAPGACEQVEAGRSLGPASGPRASAHPRDTNELLSLLGARRSDDRPLVVVETTPLDIGTGQPAIDHCREAFALGAHVITANKGPIAHAYAQLSAEARACGVHLLFEGTVMDGVPIFNLVRETLPATRVIGFRGVVNSTTNFALGRMEAGESLASAIADMQAQGIAEADPSLDVDGWDAAAKTAALMNVWMGAGVRPGDVARTGIGGLTTAMVQEARARGRRVKLVASASLCGGTASGTVAPVELGASDPLAMLDGTSNALVIETDLLGRLAITQIDAGLTHTAYALLSDLVWLTTRLSLTARG
jgi:homoserine dehydrogenase